MILFLTSCIDGVFSCVDDLRRPGTSEQSTCTAAGVHQSTGEDTMTSIVRLL